MSLEDVVKSFVTQTLPYHLANSFAQLSVATPIFAIYETAVAGMTPEQSTNTRVWSAAITLAGIGYLDAKWRDWIRKKRNIDDQTDERTQRRTDKASKILFNIGRAAVTYLPINPVDIIRGNVEVRDWTKVGRGIGLGVGYGGLFGGWSGYAMDLYRDLSGVSKSKRIPQYVQNLSSKMKKATLIGLCAASIGTTAAVYETIPKVRNAATEMISQKATPHDTETSGDEAESYRHLTIMPQ